MLQEMSGQELREWEALSAVRSDEQRARDADARGKAALARLRR